MATVMTLRINYVDAAVAYAVTPADYIAVDLAADYLIWTAGDTVIKDLMTGTPTEAQLNAASALIDPDVAYTVPLTLLFDYSHNVGGSYYTHAIKGCGGANSRYVYAFSFDGETATEPQLEAWDTSAHSTTAKHVLGAGTPTNSMVKAVCTTDGLPGASWVGTAIAGSGATRVLKLNNGNGALDALPSGETSQELYANIKIEIPAAYATPAVEAFVLTIRYSWN